MRARIIGISYNKNEDKETNVIKEGVQLRYAFALKGVIGSEVKSDYINDKDVIDVFRPFIEGGHMDDLIGMNAYIDMLPFEFKGNKYLKIVAVELMDDKVNTKSVK